MHVATIENEDAVREGLSPIINATIRFCCVGCYRTFEDAVASIDTTTQDVVLVDIGLPGMSGIERIRILRERFAGTPILALAVYHDDDVFKALCAGASRHALKNAPPEGASYRLTAQETELLKLLVDGHHYKTAAEEMRISVNTISFHLKNIYGKLRVHSKTEAVAKALRERLV